MQNKIIAIGGGVGPMAGVGLHRLIIENTITNGIDQDHLEVHHLSRPHDITDRTKFLLGEVSENPANGMFHTVQAMHKASEILNKDIVLGIPCNTFHAPKIFDPFIERIQKNNIEIQILHVVKEVVDFIFDLHSNIKKIGIISTTGTHKSSIFNDFLKSHHIEIIEIPQRMQSKVHDSIYNPKWGIKATSPVSKRARKNFLKYVDILSKNGAEVIILSCTEIPLALPEKEINNIPLINPLLVLARALIREVDENKLKPL